MTQVLSTGGVPGLQDGEWEEVSDCWGGGVLNGEFKGEKSFFLEIISMISFTNYLWSIMSLKGKIHFFRNNIDDKFHKIFVINVEFEGKNQFSYRW